MAGKVGNEVLLEAGLALLRRKGESLERVPTGNRAMVYRLSDGKTVRVRTCNDHVLVVLADSADVDAKLNIDGTDHILIVMPEIPRTEGNVIAYFLPAPIAISAVRQAHAQWLASNPKTSGNNRTWNIWFGDDVAKSGGFASKWAKYRVQGAVSTGSETPNRDAEARTGNLGAVIADARRRIAEAAGVPMECVKISVALD